MCKAIRLTWYDGRRGKCQKDIAVPDNDPTGLVSAIEKSKRMQYSLYRNSNVVGEVNSEVVEVLEVRKP